MDHFVDFNTAAALSRNSISKEIYVVKKEYICNEHLKDKKNSGIVFSEVIFEDFSFVQTDFGGNSFYSDIFKNTIFENCSFYNCYFYDIIFHNCIFSECLFGKSEFYHCSFEKCVFTIIDMRWSYHDSSIFIEGEANNSNFTGLILTNTKFLLTKFEKNIIENTNISESILVNDDKLFKDNKEI